MVAMTLMLMLKVKYASNNSHIISYTRRVQSAPGRGVNLTYDLQSSMHAGNIQNLPLH